MSDQYRDSVQQMDREVYERLVDSLATGRWPDGRALTDAQRQRCILAGGLGQSNVAAAQATGLTRFDFNSRLERSKGSKDAGLILQLFQHIRQYGKTNHE